jgi:cytochrome bd-type quinol oxidase subunit 2
MWSDSFRAEERAAIAPGPLETTLSWLAVVVGVAVLVAEVVLSVVVTTQTLTSRTRSWWMALLSVFLGVLGPYGSTLAWRSRRYSAMALPRRAAATAGTAVALGAVCLAWLVLIHTSQHGHSNLLPF